MKKIYCIFAFLCIMTGNLFSQTSSPYEDLLKVVEKDRAQLPISMGEYGTIVNAYLEDAYYITVCEINNLSFYTTMNNNKKVVKQSIINTLSQDSDAIYSAQLLIACNKELKYLYIYKPKGWKIEIILTLKDLKNLIKQ